MHSPSNTQYQRSRGSRSRVIIVMNACTETKSVGLALKLDYFLVGPQTSYPSPEVFSTIKNYVNLDVDTVSMTRDTEYMAFPEYIPWICGKCNVNDKCDADPCCVGCNSAAGDNAPGAVRCVAVDFMRWMGPDDEQLEMGTWEICQSHGVKEILLVVGNVGVVEWERDTSWVAPTQSPLLTHLYMTRELKVPENRVKTSHAREKGMVRSMRYWDVRDLFEEHLRALGGVLGLICLNEVCSLCARKSAVHKDKRAKSFGIIERRTRHGFESTAVVNSSQSRMEFSHVFLYL
jgi:hypothetical protein